MGGYCVHIFSEIHPLEQVLIHSPGPEVENMTPDLAQKFLFNDIVIYEEIKKQHSELKSVLALTSTVLELTDLLADVLGERDVAHELIARVSNGHRPTLSFLESLNAPALAKALLEGLPASPQGLEKCFGSPTPLDGPLPPLPNAYFTRDTAVSIGHHVICPSMAYSVRDREALLMGMVFKHHPKLRNRGTLWGAPTGGGQGPGQLFLEGGDILVVSPSLLLVGVGERTSARAVESLLLAWSQAQGHPVVGLCVRLPALKSAIHLDMIFTFVNEGQAVAYAPSFQGPLKCPVAKVEVDPSGHVMVQEVDDLFRALGTLGHPTEPIWCGGGKSPYDAREQWNSGANFFTISPGKSICYNIHEYTLKACQNHGYRIYSAAEVQQNPSLLDLSAPPAIVTIGGSELARGGGGPRCMTCPISRKSPAPN